MEIGKTLEIVKASSMGDEGRDGEEDQKEEAVAHLAKSTGDMPSSTATDLQKKLRRAERFRVPVFLSEKEKRNSRAERFGTAPSSEGSSSEEQKRKTRAERFGTAKAEISTCDEETKKKARLARFAGDNSKPILNSVVEDQKRQARAIRRRLIKQLKMLSFGVVIFHPEEGLLGFSMC